MNTYTRRHDTLPVPDAAFNADDRKAPKPKRKPKPFKCLECGHRMTTGSAERAAMNGCRKCGGVDIDLA